MNRCVACGEVIPEGIHICPNCMKEALGIHAGQSARLIVPIDDIRNEAIKEFSDELLKVLDTEVMPRYEASNIDYTYRNGAKMCRLDVEIEITKLLRKFKEKEKNNG